MAQDHTYEKWQELGYQVKNGEHASYKLYGQKIFKRNQVVKISDKDYDKSYENHCWNCKEHISSDSDEYCSKCGMYHCSNCGVCLCDKN